MREEFDPRIMGFLCSWCSYTGADMAGVGRMQYPANIRIVRIMCSGRMDPLFVVKAFESGADGVLVSGCHPGDCHYSTGNYYTRRRFAVMRKLIDFIGIDSRRLKVTWVSGSEGAKFADIVRQFTTELKELGPLDLKRRNRSAPRTQGVFQPSSASSQQQAHGNNHTSATTPEQVHEMIFET
jgi:F420-non-reducing hydrogenase iron-sulfur subunit